MRIRDYAVMCVFILVFVIALIPNSTITGSFISGAAVSETFARSSISNLEAGRIQSAEFNKSSVAVSSIIVESNGDVNLVNFEIESYTVNPGLPDTKKTFIYKYFEVKTNLDPDLITSAHIDFKVENSWLVRNSINRQSIRLLRLHGDNWETLETEQINKDDIYVYYRARTPSFSYFAIFGSVLKPSEIIALEQEINKPIIPPEEPSPEYGLEEKESKLPYYVAVIIVIVTVAILFVMAKRKKTTSFGPPPREHQREIYQFFEKR